MVAGTVTGVAFAIAQSRCDGSVAGDLGGEITPHAPTCSGYGVGAGIGVAMVIVGVALVCIGVLLTTPLFRDRPGRQDPPGLVDQLADEPEDRPADDSGARPAGDGPATGEVAPAGT